MSATSWLIIAIVGFSLSGIALVTAIILFVKLNIPAVIGDLSGKTIAREIKAMRDANESSGRKLHQASPINVERGQLTEKVNTNEIVNDARNVANISKRLDITGSNGINAKQQLEILQHSSATDLSSYDIAEVDRKTDVLRENQGTEILSDNYATEVLKEDKGTEVLSEGTVVLDDVSPIDEGPVQPISFRVTRSIVKIHSNEVI